MKTIQYVCKNSCCSVRVECSGPKDKYWDITLNGSSTTTGALAASLEVESSTIRKRMANRKCLATPALQRGPRRGDRKEAEQVQSIASRFASLRW